jgi:hypothetical protein
MDLSVFIVLDLIKGIDHSLAIRYVQCAVCTKESNDLPLNLKYVHQLVSLIVNSDLLAFIVDLENGIMVLAVGRD